MASLRVLADLLHILWRCAPWSVLSIGGNGVAVSDIDCYAVDTAHWLIVARFIAFLAISRALAGQNGTALVLIGQEAARLPGAITARIAKLVPTSFMAYPGAAWYERYRERIWVKRLRVALPPVTVGLLLAATSPWRGRSM